MQRRWLELLEAVISVLIPIGIIWLGLRIVQWCFDLPSIFGALILTLLMAWLCVPILVVVIQSVIHIYHGEGTHWYEDR